MRTLIPTIVTLAAMLSYPAAQAEDVYKWVDANGVTNYSGAPPANWKEGSKLDVVAQRVSVYAPDAALQRAQAAARARADRALDMRVGSLERSLEAERQMRQYAAMADTRAAQAAYERCIAERRVDCDSYGGYPPGIPVVIGAARFRPRPFVPTVPLAGVTAGNVTDAIRLDGGTINPTPGALGTRLGSLRGMPATRTGMAFGLR